MNKKVIKHFSILMVYIICFSCIFSYSASAHFLSSWASYYPASSANSTYSFGIDNSVHINGTKIKYYWANSTVSSYYATALSLAFTKWGGLISGTNVSSTAYAHITISYTSTLSPAGYAALAHMNSGDTNQHIRIGYNDAYLEMFKTLNPYTDEQNARLIAHEVGHFWGIDDLSGTSLHSIYREDWWNVEKPTYHDRNAMRIGLNDLWFNPGGNQVWKYQPAPGTFIKRADVNQNGTVNSSDAQLVLQFSSHTVTPTSLQSILADVNGDGSVTSADAQQILKYSAHLISKFPTDIYEI